MKIVLFDTVNRSRLFPLTLTKAVADLRVGILTIKERWEKLTGLEVSVLTDNYLQSLYAANKSGDCVFIDACVIPSASLVKEILALHTGAAIADDTGLIAGRTSADNFFSINNLSQYFQSPKIYTPVKRISSPVQLFQWNDEMVRSDFNLITRNRISDPLNETVQVTKASQVFIEEGAKVDYANLNASTGPIYIGRNAIVMEGSFIRGPFALCEGGVLKMGSKVYGATTIGPYSTGGGEIKNCILSGYSNKGHDGYLGDSVLGEWCNLGAGTSNSNLKNTGGEVNMWDYYTNSYIPSGTKCGVIMGDYTRTAINTSINTGSVTGICCNIFGTNLTPKFIKDFSWGFDGTISYDFKKAIQDIANWKKMKNKTVSESQIEVLKHIFENYR